MRSDDGAIRELLKLAEVSRNGCLICRSIAEANRNFAGVLEPVRLGTLVLKGADLELHLRACTSRIARGTAT